MEIQQQNAAEQKKMSQSLTLDGESRQKEVKNHLILLLKALTKSCIKSSLLHFFQKYDRAVMKINQLKEEREELRGRVESQSEEISM